MVCFVSKVKDSLTFRAGCFVHTVNLPIEYGNHNPTTKKEKEKIFTRQVVVSLYKRYRTTYGNHHKPQRSNYQVRPLQRHSLTQHHRRNRHRTIQLQPEHNLCLRHGRQGKPTLANTH